jgi:N-acetylneuraminic acid mutarotase
VERYCPRTNEWQPVAGMHESRFGCAVVAHQGKIYVSGGFGQDKVVFFLIVFVQAILSSVESYDPETDKWTKLVHMKKVRPGWLLNQHRPESAHGRQITLTASLSDVRLRGRRPGGPAGPL